MCDSTKKFFCMFALHMCSGSPVEADCMWAKSSGDCWPSPIGSVAFKYSSPAFLTRSIRSSQGISRRAARACVALRMSRCNSPALAWLTLAIGSPVMKWTTLSTSSESYGLPQRRIGMLSTCEYSGLLFLSPSPSMGEGGE